MAFLRTKGVYFVHLNNLVVDPVIYMNVHWEVKFLGVEILELFAV